MKKKDVFNVITCNEPIEKEDLFFLLRYMEPNFTKNALDVHLSRLRKENKIITIFGKKRIIKTIQ